MNLGLLNSLRQVGKAPPQGLWSTKIQERCYCFKTFLVNYSLHLDPDINTEPINKTLKQLSQEARDSCNGDWPEYCALLIEESLLPNEINQEAFEATCKYLVTGENEFSFVPEDIRVNAQCHVNSLYKEWLTKALSKEV